MKTGDLDYYSILNLDPTKASHEDVAKAFRRLALEFHPFKDDKQIAER